MAFKNKESMVSWLLRKYGRAEILRLVKELPEGGRYCPGCDRVLDPEEFGQYDYCLSCYRLKQKFHKINNRSKDKNELGTVFEFGREGRET